MSLINKLSYHKAYRYFFPKHHEHKELKNGFTSSKQALYPDDRPKGKFDTGYHDYNVIKPEWLEAFIDTRLIKLSPDNNKTTGGDVDEQYQKAEGWLQFEAKLMQKVAKMQIIKVDDIVPMFDSSIGSSASKQAKQHFNNDCILKIYDGDVTNYSDKIKQQISVPILSADKSHGYRKVNHVGIAQALWTGVKAELTRKQHQMIGDLQQQGDTHQQAVSVAKTKIHDPNVPLSPWRKNSVLNPLDKPQLSDSDSDIPDVPGYHSSDSDSDDSDPYSDLFNPSDFQDLSDISDSDLFGDDSDDGLSDSDSDSDLSDSDSDSDSDWDDSDSDSDSDSDRLFNSDDFF